MSRRIRHLSSVHDITDTRVSYKECGCLGDAGYEVALINTHDGDSTVAGIPVIGVGAPRNRIHRILIKTWVIFIRALREKADIYHFHDPELMGVGLALRLLGKKVVYDVHEDVPLQIMNKTWIPGWAKRPLAGIVRVLEGISGRLLSGVVAATPSIAEKFPDSRTVVVQNFPEKGLAVEHNDRPFHQRRHAFIYIGGLSEQQGLFEMLDAFARLDEATRGWIAGRFKHHRDRAEAHPGWSRVDHAGLVRREEIVAGLRDAQVGIVLDHPISNYVEGYSTKMFEYMACGLPVVCSDFELWQRIVGEADCGITVDPFDADSVTEALTRLLSDPQEAARMGENGRQAILSRYNWDVEFEKLLGLYERL